MEWKEEKREDKKERKIMLINRRNSYALRLNLSKTWVKVF